jgi:hypothetical protein
LAIEVQGVFPHQLYLNNDKLQDPRARAQVGYDSTTKHSQFISRPTTVIRYTPAEQAAA